MKQLGGRDESARRCHPVSKPLSLIILPLINHFKPRKSSMDHTPRNYGQPPALTFIARFYGQGQQERTTRRSGSPDRIESGWLQTHYSPMSKHAPSSINTRTHLPKWMWSYSPLKWEPRPTVSDVPVTLLWCLSERVTQLASLGPPFPSKDLRSISLEESSFCSPERKSIPQFANPVHKGAQLMLQPRKLLKTSIFY